MEASAFQSCQQACISQDYKGFDVLADVKNVELRCSVSACISRCINEQIRECGDSKSLGQLYNEVSGAQMLLGKKKIHSRKKDYEILNFQVWNKFMELLQSKHPHLLDSKKFQLLVAV